ncbi:hypothetical protein ACQPX6_08170 [Actinomycetospora sp. CA-101289]|uniref:hypothetical protein n=1 Tax=Actinomycetospora sp. CA-101289 TaxID=3239893 RepID=UPI003D95C406
MPIKLEVTQTGLRVGFTGLDRAAACRRSLDVPFERVVGSRVMSRADAVASSPLLPCPGSWWPGRLRVGSWGIGERRQLWGVHGGAEAVVVYLSGRPFHRVVVEVDDCRQAHRLIDAALLRSKKCGARQSLRAVLGETGDEGFAVSSRRRR